MRIESFNSSPENIKKYYLGLKKQENKCDTVLLTKVRIFVQISKKKKLDDTNDKLESIISI